MSSLFKRLSKIGKQSKYSVYGWIREMEEALDINHVPLMISSICVLYYHEEEMFDVIGDGVILSENKKCITTSTDDQTNNYGIIQVASNQPFVYKWDLKLKIKAKQSTFVIGISSKINSSSSAICNMDGHRYVLWDDGDINNVTSREYVDYQGAYTKYCKDLQGNESVSVKLDLKLKQISFVINGEDKGIAYDNIHVGNDIKYRLFVVTWGENASVQILNFSKS